MVSVSPMVKAEMLCMIANGVCVHACVCVYVLASCVHACMHAILVKCVQVVCHMCHHLK